MDRIILCESHHNLEKLQDSSSKRVAETAIRILNTYLDGYLSG